MCQELPKSPLRLKRLRRDVHEAQARKNYLASRSFREAFLILAGCAARVKLRTPDSQLDALVPSRCEFGVADRLL